MLIKALNEINYEKNDIVTFDGTVISITSDGDGEKRPFKFVIKLEESGETVSVSSWKFDNLETIKELVNTDEVYRFEGSAGTFGNFGQQIRIGNIQTTGLKSKRKIISKVDINEIKSEISELVKLYIHTDSIKNIINKLIFENEDYWKWPAASKIHHAYLGGLAKHSLGATKLAVATWKAYGGAGIDIEVIVAGTLLHDIGKMLEYKLDGTRTIYGNLIPHPVSGERKIYDTAKSFNIDPDKDMKILMIRHVILSHHEKLEFGSPVVPNTAEAWIVASADAEDAKVESILSGLKNIERYEQTERLKSLDGGSVLKWI